MRPSATLCVLGSVTGWRASTDAFIAAFEKHGKKVKFLTFKEAQERLDKHLLAGQPLRHPRYGDDNGVRLLDDGGCLPHIVGRQAGIGAGDDNDAVLGRIVHHNRSSAGRSIHVPPDQGRVDAFRLIAADGVRSEAVMTDARNKRNVRAESCRRVLRGRRRRGSRVSGDVPSRRLLSAITIVSRRRFTELHDTQRLSRL